MLRNVIVRRARHSEFIRSAIHDLLDASKIVMRRRRRDRPFERRRVPWILFLRFLPRKQAPEEVEQEDELRTYGNKRRNADENMDRLQLLQKFHRGCVEVAPRMCGQPQEVHRHENAVNTDEREPKVNLADPLIQEPTKHLGEPEIQACEHPEDGRDTHDQVKVRDHEVPVMQVEVECRLRQEQAGKSAAYEQRYKPES